MRFCQIISVGFAVFSLIPSVALAAKAHREGKTSIESEFPAIKGEIKKACGCEPAFSVDWNTYNGTAANDAKSFAKIIVYSAKSVSKATAKFCNDGESKKLFCQNAKTVHFVPKGISEAKVTHDEKAHKLTIESSRDMAVSESQVTKKLNEW